MMRNSLAESRHEEAQQQQQNCRPYDFRETGFASICQYVRNNSELCEGGGYLLWTEMELCTESALGQAATVLIALMFFLFLFLHLSTTADSFFCKNIASIVDLHKISQNIAGITFMAFGNGAPDIFSSIASVTSISRPRAELAISELLGGGIFVTTCVIAAIAYRPFLLMRRPILRDICFYLAALLLLVFVAHGEGKMLLWQPLAFLLLYILYALTVVSGNVYRQRMSPTGTTRGSKMHRAIAKLVPMPKKVAPVKGPPKGSTGMVAAGEIANGELILTPQGMEKQPSATHQTVVVANCAKKSTQQQQQHVAAKIATRDNLQLPEGILVVLACQHQHANGHHHHRPQQPQHGIANDEGEEEGDFHALDCLEAGKFFGKEELDADETTTEEEEQAATTVTTPSTASSSFESSVVTLPSMLSSDSSSNSGSQCSSPELGRQKASGGIGTVLGKEARRFWCQLAPLDVHKYRCGKWHERVYRIAKMPCMLLLKLTVPCAYQSWSKPMALLHAFMAPLVLCGAFKWTTLPVGNSPLVVGELALLLSVFLVICILLFTSFQQEPGCYRWIASYTGFVLSIAWIYATAAEVLNVVLMFGTLSHIPYQILGLTAIAWCNSIGDMIADISVARQRMPRMAFSAAIGAPLFNLLVGFGSTFLIAEIQGKTVTIHADPVSNVMFLFLGISLVTTLVLLLIQRFYVRRIHGLILLVLYLLFLICVILAELGIFRIF